LVQLVTASVRPLRVTRASAAAGLGFAAVAAIGALVYFGHPAILAESDQLTSDALLRALGGWRVTTLVFGGVLVTVALLIAYRAWGGLVALVAVASIVWMAVGEPAMDAATTQRDTLKPFALAVVSHFAPGHPLAFYGGVVRQVVVYVGRPVPSLDRMPERIAPGQGVIAREPVYRALAAAGRVGPPLATATGRVDALERATLVLAEGKTPP
jgi:hypothetical protein